MEYAPRIRRLRTALAAHDVPSFLVTHLADVRYLCGFTGSNGVLAVSPKRAVLFTDSRYTFQARAETTGVRVVIPKEKSVLLAACELLAADGASTVTFDAEHMTVGQLATLRSALPKEHRRKLLQPAKQPWVGQLRMVKDAEEQNLMLRAAALGDRLFEQILPFLEPGVSEMAVAAQLEHQARLAGAEAMAFSTIVASGPRSALPHGTATTAKLPLHGFVTLDFGVILNGYCSDMTRTVHMGRARPEEREAYEAVHEAQEAGVAAVRPGVACGDVDRACRDVLGRHKMARYFKHSTGHGVGLEIHEAPRVGKDQKDILEPGMIITIEPGIYMAGDFGLRIEDTVVVESDRAQILTKSTKAWIEL